MLKISRRIVIGVPPERVFEAIDDTDSLPQLWRNLSNIRDLKRLPNGGHSFLFDYTMAGVRIDGSSVDLQFVPPQRIVTRTTGGVQSTLTWVLNPLPDGAGTELLLDIEYTVPVPLLGKLAEAVVAKVNEADIVYMLNYLKLKLEKETR